MATTDAIAFLGDTLALILRDGLNGLVAPADIVLSTPEAFKDFAPRKPSVTIFVYHVGINGEMRNSPVRTLVTGGIQRPPLPLDLRFMLTPWTNTPGKPINVATRDAYRIIGAMARLFYDKTVLSSGELLGDNVWAPDDTVEILMESLPVEQHYDIWEATDIPYRLSLAYLARILGIDSAVVTTTAPVEVATFPELVP